jgi:hypothetical protein
LKKEHAKLREQREADLLRQADEFSDLLEASKQAVREGKLFLSIVLILFIFPFCTALFMNLTDSRV